MVWVDLNIDIGTHSNNLDVCRTRFLDIKSLGLERHGGLREWCQVRLGQCHLGYCSCAIALWPWGHSMFGELFYHGRVEVLCAKENIHAKHLI